MAWYNVNYLKKKALTIDHTKVSGGGDLSSFPVLISMTDANMKTVANSGSVQNTSGFDIIFTDSTEMTKLDHEIELYTATTGAIVMWVRIPTLSHTTDTVIYCYYDNSAISTSQENKTGVWDSNYSGVWHFPNGTTLTVADSTSNANNGTITSTTATTGQIDGAASFNGSSSSLSVPNASPLNFSNGDTITISAWAKRGATGGWQAFLANGNQNFTTPGRNYELAFVAGLGASTNALGFNYSDAPQTYQQVATSTAYTDTTNWHYYAFTYTYGTGSSAAFYVDGAVSASSWTSGDGNAATVASTQSIGIGANLNGFDWFNGSLDEVRLSKGIARSADWITTEYNNQNSPSTFYSVGSTFTYNAKLLRIANGLGGVFI